MAKWLTRKFLNWFSRKRGVPDVRRLSGDAEGITVETGGREGKAYQQLILWNDIIRVVVFKRDLYSRDMICLLMETSAAGVHEFREDMPGWGPLVKSLQGYLPSAVPYADWFLKVMSPAYETLPVAIYRREW